MYFMPLQLDNGVALKAGLENIKKAGGWLGLSLYRLIKLSPCVLPTQLWFSFPYSMVGLRHFNIEHG